MAKSTLPYMNTSKDKQLWSNLQSKIFCRNDDMLLWATRLPTRRVDIVPLYLLGTASCCFQAFCQQPLFPQPQNSHCTLAHHNWTISWLFFSLVVKILKALIKFARFRKLSPNTVVGPRESLDGLSVLTALNNALSFVHPTKLEWGWQRALNAGIRKEWLGSFPQKQ